MDMLVGITGVYDLVDSKMVERVILAKRIGRQLAKGCEVGDKTVLEGVARKLCFDKNEAVREALSFEVRRYDSLPADIADVFARDSSDVAQPFLEDTKAMTEEALILVIRSGTGHALAAIARRRDLSEAMVQSLAEHADERAATVLTRNDHITLSEAVCAKLIERFPASAHVMSELALREDLPPQAKKAMEKYLEGNTSEAYKQLDQALSFSDILMRIRHIHRRGELSADKIRSLVRTGGRDYLEASLVVAAGLPRRNVSILLEDGGGRGRVELFRRAGIREHEIEGLLSMIGKK